MPLYDGTFATSTTSSKFLDADPTRKAFTVQNMSTTAGEDMTIGASGVASRAGGVTLDPGVSPAVKGDDYTVSGEMAAEEWHVDANSGTPTLSIVYQSRTADTNIT